MITWNSIGQGNILFFNVSYRVILIIRAAVQIEPFTAHSDGPFVETDCQNTRRILVQTMDGSRVFQTALLEQRNEMPVRTLATTTLTRKASRFVPEQEILVASLEDPVFKPMQPFFPIQIAGIVVYET